MEIVNFVEFGVLLSLFGFALLFYTLRLPKSKNWQSSSILKKILGITISIILQLPLFLTIIFKPPYVTSFLEVEIFSYYRVFQIYLPVTFIFLIIWIIGKFKS